LYCLSTRIQTKQIFYKSCFILLIYAEKQEPQRKKIGAWIAPELYEQVEALGYKTWTEAIIRGLELIISEKQLGQNRAQIVAPGAHLGDSG